MDCLIYYFKVSCSRVLECEMVFAVLLFLVRWKVLNAEILYVGEEGRN